MIKLLPTLRVSVLILALSLAFAHESQARLCDHSYEFCGYVTGGRSSTTPAAPSQSSSVNINPSAVPIEKGFGLEAIVFKGTPDFSIVKGMGRVGAAISPSNTEETFFGPPGFELPEEMLIRKQERQKYPSQKITLATAFGLFNNKQKGISRFEMNLGLMAKYNKISNHANPGGGVSGILGPMTFGYSIYADEFVLDYERYGLAQKDLIHYGVETFSVGLFLSSFAVDYSVLRMVANDVSTVSVLTGTFMHKIGLFTLAARKEVSNRPYYNYATQILEPLLEKNDVFVGAQFAIGSSWMLGGFYNYYALHELSLGATLFF